MIRRPALLALILLTLPAGASARGAGGRGLWVGPIHVCRDAAQVITGTDRRGEATATITLRPELRARLERETGRRVGRPMPVRLNGRTISAPTVMEPLTAGVVMLYGPTQRDAEAIRAAAGRAC